MLGPWMLGSELPTSQIILASLAALTFLLLFIPLPGKSTTVWRNCIILFRFPAFWLGLLFIAYIVIQVANPAWQYFPTTRGIWFWEMAPLPQEAFISWMPTGFRTLEPFTGPNKIMDGSRHLMILAGGFLLTCALWVGLRSRKALLGLLWVLSINGALLAMLVFLQKITGTTSMLWTYEPRGNPPFVGTFLYRNHGAAYLYLCMGCACALGLFHLIRDGRSSAKSSPFPLLFLFAVLMLLAVFISTSRGGVILATVLVSLVLCILVLRIMKSGWRRFAFLCAGLVCVAGVGLFFATQFRHGIDETIDRFKDDSGKLSTDTMFLSKTDTRVRQYIVTWQMFLDSKFTGWGAAGFAYFFPSYQIRDVTLFYRPEVAIDPQAKVDEFERRGYYTKYFFPHAHSTWLQALVEYGILGCLPLYLALLSFFAIIAISYKGLASYHLILLGSTVLILGHSLIDAILNNPPIFYTFSAVLVTVTSLVRLRAKRTIRTDAHA